MADENVPGTVIAALRTAGHDAASVKQSMRAAGDRVVLARAQAEQRIIITHDKDFGELAFRFGLPATCGVILFPLAGRDPEHDNRRMLSAMRSRTDWAGHFAVVTDDRIRIRPPARWIIDTGALNSHAATQHHLHALA